MPLLVSVSLDMNMTPPQTMYTLLTKALINPILLGGTIYQTSPHILVRKNTTGPTFLSFY